MSLSGWTNESVRCRECGAAMNVVDLMRLPKPYQCGKCCQVEESAELVRNDGKQQLSPREQWERDKRLGILDD